MNKRGGGELAGDASREGRIGQAAIAAALVDEAGRGRHFGDHLVEMSEELGKVGVVIADEQLSPTPALLGGRIEPP